MSLLLVFFQFLFVCSFCDQTKKCWMHDLLLLHPSVNFRVVFFLSFFAALFSCEVGWSFWVTLHLLKQKNYPHSTSTSLKQAHYISINIIFHVRNGSLMMFLSSSHLTHNSFVFMIVRSFVFVCFDEFGFSHYHHHDDMHIPASQQTVFFFSF